MPALLPAPTAFSSNASEHHGTLSQLALRTRARLHKYSGTTVIDSPPGERCAMSVGLPNGAISPTSPAVCREVCLCGDGPRRVQRPLAGQCGRERASYGTPERRAQRPGPTRRWHGRAVCHPSCLEALAGCVKIAGRRATWCANPASRIARRNVSVRDYQVRAARKPWA